MPRSQSSGSLQQHVPASAVSTGAVLHTMAVKRRARFTSPTAALQNFQDKPPFSRWHPEALQAYVQYGTRPLAECSCGGVQPEGCQQTRSTSFHMPAATTTAPSTAASEVGAGCTEVQLRCEPLTEAAVYAAFEPPPLLDPAALHCPAALAVGGAVMGLHAGLPVSGVHLAQQLPRGSLRR